MAQGTHIGNLYESIKEISKEGFTGDITVKLGTKSLIEFFCGDRNKSSGNEKNGEKSTVYFGKHSIICIAGEEIMRH